jgi:hypothetical protein
MARLSAGITIAARHLKVFRKTDKKGEKTCV